MNEWQQLSVLQITVVVECGCGEDTVAEAALQFTPSQPTRHVHSYTAVNKQHTHRTCVVQLHRYVHAQ